MEESIALPRRPIHLIKDFLLNSFYVFTITKGITSVERGPEKRPNSVHGQTLVSDGDPTTSVDWTVQYSFHRPGVESIGGLNVPHSILLKDLPPLQSVYVLLFSCEGVTPLNSK